MPCRSPCSSGKTSAPLGSAEAPEELRLWIMGALGGKKWKAPAADYALQLAQRVMAAPSLQFSGSSNGGIDAVVRLNAQQLIEYAGCSIAHATSPSSSSITLAVKYLCWSVWFTLGAGNTEVQVQPSAILVVSAVSTT